MRGVGVFFNQCVDLERIAALAAEGKINWISPIMAPDQSSVQLNRNVWSQWRARMPNVKFIPWIVGDDPVQDFERAQWVVNEFTSDGILLNLEQPYEGGGYWKGSVLCNSLMKDPKLGPMPKILSYPSTPAERYAMDWRAFQKAGMWFAPQAYWNEFPGSTPRALYLSTYLPQQVHVGWNYRMQIYGVRDKHWGKIVAWDGMYYATIKDLVTTKLYRVAVDPRSEGDYRYMLVAFGRNLYDYKTAQTVTGRLLGFQEKTKIVPTVGVYDIRKPPPEEVRSMLDDIAGLTGASLYLGDTSESAHVRAVWEAVNA